MQQALDGFIRHMETEKQASDCTVRAYRADLRKP